MAKITSSVVRFGVTVTYNDGSSSLMHGQVDNDIPWSIEQTESFETAKQVSWFEVSQNWPYWSAICQACVKLPAITNFDFADSHPAVQKTITDMVGKIEVILSFSNQEHASIAIVLDGVDSAVYYGGEVADISSTFAIDPTLFIAAFTAAMNEAVPDVEVNALFP